MKIDKEKLMVSMARAQLCRSEVAEKSGLSVNTLSGAFSRGSCKPATAGKIAKALGVDVTEIIETED